jgi:hypothetical protein
MRIPASLAAIAVLLASASTPLCAQVRPASTAAPVEAAPAVSSPELDSARAALEKYRDPVAAVHDGYLSTLACLDYREGLQEGSMRYEPGGMGVHFLNPQLIGPTLDPTKPQVLIYAPEGDTLRLVAAEWFVPVQVAGATRPAIFGRQLDGPMEGHHPLMPAGLHHYDLHVWLWQDNPAGVFSSTNPALKCPAGRYSLAGHTPKLVPHGKH